MSVRFVVCRLAIAVGLSVVAVSSRTTPSVAESAYFAPLDGNEEFTLGGEPGPEHFITCTISASRPAEGLWMSGVYQVGGNGRIDCSPPPPPDFLYVHVCVAFNAAHGDNRNPAGWGVISEGCGSDVARGERSWVRAEAVVKCAKKGWYAMAVEGKAVHGNEAETNGWFLGPSHKSTCGAK